MIGVARSVHLKLPTDEPTGGTYIHFSAVIGGTKVDVCPPMLMVLG